jgi:hypothetical protein
VTDQGTLIGRGRATGLETASGQGTKTVLLMRRWLARPG